MHNSAQLESNTRRNGASASRSIVIREMGLADIAPVYELGESLFTADRWPVLYRTWDEYELATLFTTDGETCLVAEHQQQVVGFALGLLIEKRRSAWRYGYLLWLGVDPAFGRCGLGTRLVKELIQRFDDHGVRMLLADTAVDNQEALGFLRKLGFGKPQKHLYLAMNLDHHPEHLGASSRAPNNGVGGQRSRR
jgi:ribosomal protein S18 acetylase RimI-like enzyme